MNENFRYSGALWFLFGMSCVTLMFLANGFSRSKSERAFSTEYAGRLTTYLGMLMYIIRRVFKTFHTINPNRRTI